VSRDAGSPRSRREFLALASAGPLADWIPFLHRRHISLAGARFRILRNDYPRRHYLAIHGDEETAREVLEIHMQAYQGIAYIIESRTRNVPIEGGEIDPNRMFSGAGAEASLKSLNPAWDQPRIAAALATLERGRTRLVRALFPAPGGLLVALHNNTEAYSVADERPISDSESIRDPEHPHAFFLCTDPSDFKILAGSFYNVVLQRQGPRQDDGSLSRLAAARGVRYVNLEVERGARDRQQEMLDWLEWHLPETPNQRLDGRAYTK